MNYQNKYRIEDFNASIIEWDIKSANTSICREYNLLPASLIDKIEGMHKSKREKQIGLIMRKDKDFAKKLEECFDIVMQEFIDQNGLDLDWDIISIRRDAAFVINKEIKKPLVGKHVLFRPKGIYSHHIYLKPPKGKDLDIYVNNDVVDIKGIDDELLKFHEEGMISLIRMICTSMGSSNPSKEINELFSDLVIKYKKRELPYDFYREFNPTSKFKLNLFGTETLVDSIDSDEFLEMCDISYNYEKIILPLIRLLR